MLCPRCYGSHVALHNGTRIPCPECGGVGEIHCCDGLREQPDPDGEAVEPPCRVPPYDPSPKLGLPDADAG